LTTEITKLSDIVSVGSRFGRSVNLERDFDELVSLEGYVLTTTARSALHRLAQAFQEPAASRAWTLTGPYGSGKSAFALFAAKALNAGSNDDVEFARRLIKDQDNDLWHKLFDRRRKNALGQHGLCPVLVSGSREPLNKALLRGLESAIEHYWPSSPPLFLVQVRNMLKEIQDGKVISGRQVVELFEEVAHKVGSSRKSGIGLLVVIDELGKLLEYAAVHPSESDIFVLQELAEATRRQTEHPIFLVTVLHQAFERYVERLGRAQKEEWMKVQGRFEDIAFQEPTEQILRILGEAIQHHGPDQEVQALERYGRTLARKAWTLNLTPSAAKKDDITEILAACTPLHPTVSLLIGQLFRRIGQNERSLFAFLSSHEPYGFQEFISQTGWVEKYPELLRLDVVYDYVTTALGSALYAQADGKKWAEIEAALNRAKDATELEIRLIKAIGLLRVVGDIGALTSSHVVLEFAFEGEGDKASDVGQALERLQQRSIVIFRRYNNAFSLWEGSDIDIEAKLYEARSHIDPNESLAQSLTKYFKPRPIAARRHSLETGTLRYFNVRYVDVTGFDRAIDAPLDDADGLILYGIALNAEDLKAFVDKARQPEMQQHPRVAIAIPQETAGLREAIYEVACLRWVRDKTPELEGDRTARNELQARLAKAEAAVERILQSFFEARIMRSSPAMKEGCEWYRKGERIAVDSERALQEYISQICSEVFHQAPTLHNELINRRHISSSAASARRELIAAMLHYGEQERLAIDGYPPHASMYFSLLQETGMHREENGRWGFFPPSQGSDSGTLATWEAIDHFFAETEVERRSVADLFGLLGEPPFGIKNGPLPILLCAALLHYDTEVALYEQGTFVPSLSTAVFERLVKTPDRFQLQRCRVAGVRAAIFERFANVILKKNGNFFGEKMNVLSVVRPLARFATGLPAYTKNTQRLSKTATQVRAALFEAREPDQLLFVQLPKACGLEPFTADETRDQSDVDLFFKRFRGALAELQRAYDDLLGELEGLLIAAFSLKGSGADARRELITRAQPLQDLTVEPKLKSFIIRVTDEGLDLAGWIEALATFLASKPPASWYDADMARFEMSLAEVARSFSHIELLSFELQKSGTAETSRLGHELMRLGVTSLNEPERQRVVMISNQDRLLIEKAEGSIEKALKDSGLGENTELRLAVLAKLSRKLLGEMEEDDQQRTARAKPTRKRRVKA
jgi:hypothetical protein